MANTFVTPTWVLKEVARLLVPNLKFAANVERSYDDRFSQGGAKVGYTIYARLPQRFKVTSGQAFQPQAINDATVPVSLTDQLNVGTSFSTADATMVVEDVRKRYVAPAAEALAADIDAKGLSRMYPYVYQEVGTPGTTPSTNLTFLQAGVKLTDSNVPEDGRVAILDPMTAATIANANMATFFNPQAALSEVWRKGQIAGAWMGIDRVYQSQNVAKHTTGSFTTATPLVNTASQTGSTLNCNGWASGATTLKRGDAIQIAGVYSINPLTFASTGRLQDFVVTADYSDTTGAMAALPISPPLYTAATVPAGQAPTVSALPADDAKIYVIGSSITTSSGALTATVSPQSLVYHPEAFILAMADLDNDLAGAQVSRVSSKQLNISLRFVQQYNAMTDQKASRIDGLIGWTCFRPEMACRVWG
jgi:hypothetical protein